MLSNGKRRDLNCQGEKELAKEESRATATDRGRGSKRREKKMGKNNKTNRSIATKRTCP